jgi:hypothetical protein
MALSVRLVSAPRNDGACGRGSRRGTPQGLLVRHGSGDLRFAVLARRLAGQLEEDVVERRSTQAHVADADPGAT